MKKLFTLLLTFMLALTACSDGNQNDKTPLVLQSEKEIAVGFEEGTFDVHVTCPAGYSQARAAVEENVQDWLYLAKVTPGKDSTEAVLTFHHRANDSLNPRNGHVDIFAEGSRNVLRVGILQHQEMILSVAKDKHYVSPAGGDCSISLNCSVDFDLTIETLSGKNWITWNEQANDRRLHFDVQPIPEGTKDRIAKVRVVQRNTPEGYLPLETTFTVIQKADVGLISWAADMKHNRLFPKWEKQSSNPLSNHRGTAEVLIYPRKFDNGISTVMGVEQSFLLRFGNSDRHDFESNRLFIVWDHHGWQEVKYEFDIEKWYHIAVTWDELHVRCYINGELITDTIIGRPVDVDNPWSYENSGQERCWWYGYSYDENRYFDGLMTGFRIWNRVLSAEEISRPNHFYKLSESDKDGLIANWHPTEGSGPIIGNKVSGALANAPLYGEVDVMNNRTDTRAGFPDIRWVPVVLPE